MAKLKNKNYPGVSLDMMWPWNPYRNTASVVWMIDWKLDYVLWAVSKGFKLDNEAYQYLTECKERSKLDARLDRKPKRWS